MSPEAYTTIKAFEAGLYWYLPTLELPPQEEGPRWLDISQLSFDPHFLGLFLECVSLTFRRCEIKLLLTTEDALTWKRVLPEPEFSRLIGSMFLTQPPCKSLSIHTDSGYLEPVARIVDPGGIRIGQLLSTLEQCSLQALAT